MNTDIDQIKKVNKKVITPLIVLGCTAIIAIFTYFKRYPAGDFFVIVFAFAPGHHGQGQHYIQILLHIISFSFGKIN